MPAAEPSEWARLGITVTAFFVNWSFLIRAWWAGRGRPIDDSALLAEVIDDHFQQEPSSRREPKTVRGDRMIGSRRVVLVAVIVLVGLLPGRESVQSAPPPKNCTQTSTGQANLLDAGLLYPGDSMRPASHTQAGLAAAALIQPIGGKIGMISVGMSNTEQESAVLAPLLNGYALKHPAFLFVNGAQAGRTASNWANPNCPCWATLTTRLASAGLVAGQVQAAWIKLTVEQPASDPTSLSTYLELIIPALVGRYPNIRVIYLTTRVYAGYATGTLSPEPYVYQEGLSVAALIARQIAGDPLLAGWPWLDWSYLWADGLVERSDGLGWTCANFASDGVHPSSSGKTKTANRLTGQWWSDPVTFGWMRVS